MVKAYLKKNPGKGPVVAEAEHELSKMPILSKKAELTFLRYMVYCLKILQMH